MKHLTTILCALCGLSAAADKPNILHIHADDHRADGLHAFGNPLLQTPHLDTLVERGTTFTRCYTQGFRGAQTLSIRRGPWKYLDHPGSGGNRYDQGELKPFVIPDTSRVALYNLDTDPGETKNLDADRPELVSELKALLEQSKASGRSNPGHQ